MTQRRCLSIISFSRFSGGRRLLQISTSTVSDRSTPSQSTSLRSMWCPVSSTLTPTLTLSPWQPHYAFLLESHTAVSFTGCRPGEPGCRRGWHPRRSSSHTTPRCRREIRLALSTRNLDLEYIENSIQALSTLGSTRPGRRRTRHDQRDCRGTRHRAGRRDVRPPLSTRASQRVVDAPNPTPIVDL